MDPEIVNLIAWYAVFLFSVTFHEAAHSWYAFRNGDPRAAYEGLVSLNPLPHIQRSPFGMVLLPMIGLAFTGFPFGFASAPYNPSWANREPKKAAWMALAGPISNFLIVIACMLVIRIGIAQEFLLLPEAVTRTQIVSGSGTKLSANFSVLISMLLYMNLLLLFINIIPVPPLDGFFALPLIIQPYKYRKYADFFSNQMLGFIVIIVAVNVLFHDFAGFVVFKILFAGLL